MTAVIRINHCANALKSLTPCYVFTAEFEVLETLRKIYVIYSA